MACQAASLAVAPPSLRLAVTLPAVEVAPLQSLRTLQMLLLALLLHPLVVLAVASLQCLRAAVRSAARNLSSARLLHSGVLDFLCPTSTLGKDLVHFLLGNGSCRCLFGFWRLTLRCRSVRRCHICRNFGSRHQELHTTDTDVGTSKNQMNLSKSPHVCCGPRKHAAWIR